MNYIALSDNTARQVIDSSTIFDEFTRVELQTRPYTGACTKSGTVSTSTW